MKARNQMKFTTKDLRQDLHPNKKMIQKSLSNRTKIQKLRKGRMFLLQAKSKLMYNMNIQPLERLRNQSKNLHPRAEMEDNSPGSNVNLTTSNSKILGRLKEKVLEGMIMILGHTTKVYHHDCKRNNSNNNSNGNSNNNSSIIIINIISSMVTNMRQRWIVMVLKLSIQLQGAHLLLHRKMMQLWGLVHQLLTLNL